MEAVRFPAASPPSPETSAPSPPVTEPVPGGAGVPSGRSERPGPTAAPTAPSRTAPSRTAPSRTAPSGTAPTAPSRSVPALARPPGERRAVLWTAALGAGLLVSVPATVALGPVDVPPAVVVDVVAHRLAGLGVPSWTEAQDTVVWQIRLPRVLLGVAVGALLAICGVAVQALVRNALADPYLLGISSGATTGAAASILLGVGSAAGVLALTSSAFAGALAATVVVVSVARLGGRLVPTRLVFAGIAVGFALTAVTNLIVFTSDSRDGTRAVLFWALGSLQQARWSSLLVVVPAAVVALALLLLWSRRLDALATGDDTARSLGTIPDRFRARAVVLVCLAVASAVAVSGAIGFVGLVVPHLARRLVGSVHRRVLPVAALLGGLLLIWADVLARTAFQPRELPLGVLTALIGAPLLVLLVRRSAMH